MGNRTIGYSLTLRAMVVLTLLDLRDGERLEPKPGWCSVCDGRVTVWRGLAVCRRSINGVACHGNGRAAKPRP